MGAREIQKCRISASVTSFSWLTGTDRCFWDKKLSFLNLAEIPLKMKKNIYFFVSYWFSLNLGKNSRENLGIWGFLQPSRVGKSLYLLPRCGWGGHRKEGKSHMYMGI